MLELKHLSKTEGKQNVWPGNRKYLYGSMAR